MLLKLCKGAGGVFGEVGRDWVRSQQVKGYQGWENREERKNRDKSEPGSEGMDVQLHVLRVHFK